MIKPLTADELDDIPIANRFYVCQQCKKQSQDRTLFRMVTFLRVGFVMCRDCLTGDNEDEGAIDER